MSLHINRNNPIPPNTFLRTAYDSFLLALALRRSQPCSAQTPWSGAEKQEQEGKASDFKSAASWNLEAHRPRAAWFPGGRSRVGTRRGGLQWKMSSVHKPESQHTVLAFPIRERREDCFLFPRGTCFHYYKMHADMGQRLASFCKARVTLEKSSRV